MQQAVRGCTVPAAVRQSGCREKPWLQDSETQSLPFEILFLLLCRQVFTGIALGVITAERRGTLNLSRSAGPDSARPSDRRKHGGYGQVFTFLWIRMIPVTARINFNNRQVYSHYTELSRFTSTIYVWIFTGKRCILIREISGMIN